MTIEVGPTSAKEVSGSIDELKLLFGLDTDRQWATAVQLFWNADAEHVILVFRETIKAHLSGENGEPTGDPQEILGKNVASIVLPLDVARRLGEILNTSLLPSDGPEV